MLSFPISAEGSGRCEAMNEWEKMLGTSVSVCGAEVKRVHTRVQFSYPASVPSCTEKIGKYHTFLPHLSYEKSSSQVSSRQYKYFCHCSVIAAHVGGRLVQMAEFTDFQKVEICVGEIRNAEDFPEARVPAYKLTVFFGDDIGEKKSSAQLTANYSREELIGKRVLALVNIPPRQVGPFLSEVLTLGVPDAQGEPLLLEPNANAPLGGMLY